MARSTIGSLLQPQSGNIRIERRAWRCLEDCQAKLRLTEIPFPIPVDTWIETVFDIGFGVTNLAHLGPHVLGAAYIEQREILVAETVQSNEGRFRFTCGHELGHFVLHSHLAGIFKDGELPSPDLANRWERQADRFAAAFLSPLTMFERELWRICDMAKLDAEHCLTELLMPTAASLWLWSGWFVPALMHRFGLSKAAAVFRCCDLRLAHDEERRLMPFRVRDALLGRQPFGESVDSIRLVDGRPTRLDSRSAP